jgi:hypothetical protein
MEQIKTFSMTQTAKILKTTPPMIITAIVEAVKCGNSCVVKVGKRYKITNLQKFIDFFNKLNQLEAMKWQEKMKNSKISIKGKTAKTTITPSGIRGNSYAELLKRMIL